MVGEILIVIQKSLVQQKFQHAMVNNPIILFHGNYSCVPLAIELSSILTLYKTMSLKKQLEHRENMECYHKWDMKVVRVKDLSPNLLIIIAMIANAFIHIDSASI